MKLQGMTGGQSDFSQQSTAKTEVPRPQGGQSESVDDIIKKSLSAEQLIEKQKTGAVDMPIGEKVLIEAIERANKAVEGAYTSFEYSIHEATHAIMVKVINRDTKEVIREIPPEKVLDMVARLWEMSGVFVDERR